MELAVEKDEVDGNGELLRDRKARHHGQQAAQQRMVKDEANALPELRHHAGLCADLPRERFGLADPEQGEDRDYVREGVDAHRARRADRLHEDATKTWPGKEGDGEARVQLVVPFYDVRLADEGGQVGEVGDVKDDVPDSPAQPAQVALS